MCGLCGVPARVLHWSEHLDADGRMHGASMPPSRAKRLRRVQWLDTAMRAYACTVSDWQGRAYRIATFTGKTALVENLSDIWTSVASLTGKQPSPLDDAVLQRVGALPRRVLWTRAFSVDGDIAKNRRDGVRENGEPRYLGAYRGRPVHFETGHEQAMTLVCTEPIDWTGFECWLTMFLHAEGARVDRLDALLDVGDLDSRVRLLGRHRTVDASVVRDTIIPIGGDVVADRSDRRDQPTRSTLTLTGDMPAADRLAASLTIFTAAEKVL